MITIYDIAKECNVSPATVSKVLNNYSGVSEKTKKLVLEKVKKENYLPNVMARYLNTNCSHSIGILVYINDNFDALNHAFFNSIIKYFRQTLENKQYDIILLSKSFENVKGSFLNHCRMRKIDGVLIMGDFTNNNVQELLNSDIPSVAFDYFDDNVTAISSNNYDKMYELTTYLLRLGHKKISFIYGDYNNVTCERIKAYKDALNDNNVEIIPDLLKEGKYYDFKAAMEITKALLLKKERPTAIMYQDDYSALGGYAAAYDMNIKIPEELSICGFDGIEMASLIRPKMTTIKQDCKTIGNTLALKLIEKINKPDTKVEHLTVDATFYQGFSCAAPHKD